MAERRTVIKATITPELWQRLKPLYEAAMEMPTGERAEFVERVSASDTPLKEGLRDLLAAGTDPGSLDSPLIRLGDFIEPNRRVLSEGQLLLNRFRVIRHLGSGGMGEVYEVHDLELQMGRVALKVLRPSIAENPIILSRFREEVILARKVSGPHVCRIHEFFVPDSRFRSDCGPFLTMEYLEGTTLSDRIETDGPLPPKQALTIAIQLCAALQSIHDAGVIHRDLKPRNIMLVPHKDTEKAVVMDFGLAHAISKDARPDQTRNTVPGMIMGTPEYMAPEQFEGGNASSATDIYALGLVLYELVTGKQLFAASTPYAAAVRRGRHPDSPSSVRHGIASVWDDVIAKCLEYDSESRYQSASEVIDAFHQHRLVIWTFRHGPRISLSRRSLVAIASVVLLALAVVGWFVVSDALSYHMSPEMKEWYDQGANDFREGAYLEATKAFEMAAHLDERYPVTHARLAEAWSELDFTSEAQKQMLYATAPDPKISLSKIDRKYVDAVRTTLIHDYSAAAQDYEAILKALPADKKPEGMVDLGRAYEKAGRMQEALARYEAAAKLNPNNPAPFVHLGILKSRLRDSRGAEDAFDQAEKLYQAKSSQEGEAEVDYQRGYAANEADDEARARRYLAESLNIARQIKSIQLEARTLSQLSSVEYNSTSKGHDQRAFDDANQAIVLAKENGLEYWSTDGEMRLGNIYFDEEDFDNAESHLHTALQFAGKYEHPRLEAGANLTLASVLEQENKWEEALPYAQSALRYYRDYSYLNSIADASALIARAQEGQGNYTEALRSANELLSLAQKAKSEVYIELGEQTVAGVLNDEEQYPAALHHYEEALKAAREIHSNEAYDALGRADVLWRLGRYSEAEGVIDAMSADTAGREDIGSGIANTRAKMLLSQGQYRAALTTAQKALHDFSGVGPGKRADWNLVAATAEGRLGQFTQGVHYADEAAKLAEQQKSHSMRAAVELVYADLAVRGHSPERAMTMAEQADHYFGEKDMKESGWISLHLMAEASRNSGDAAASAKFATEALDILHNMQQTWNSPDVSRHSDFTQYSNRPDHRLAIEDLVKLSKI